MSPRRHVIFGTGLIGGYLAGAFVIQGLKTSVIGRPTKLLAFANGATISDLHGNHTHVESLSEYRPELQGGNIGVLWLTVKCTAIESSIADLKPLVQANTVIVCCQNGLGSDQAVRAAFPDNHVVNAVVGFNVAEHSPGHLHRSTDGQLVVEQHSELDADVKRINSAALPAISTTNITAHQWAKLQLNLANPVNALSNIPIKSMTENVGYRKIIADLMTELLNVTDAMQLTLPKVAAVPAHAIPRILRLPNWLFKLIAQKMLAIDPSARASMWWDLSQGKITEIDYLNGAVVQQAADLGLDCPINKRLTALVHQVELGNKKIGVPTSDLSEVLNAS